MFKKTRERIGDGLQKAGNFLQNNVGVPTTLAGGMIGVASLLFPVLQPWRVGTTLLGGGLLGTGWGLKKTGQVINTTSHQLANI